MIRLIDRFFLLAFASTIFGFANVYSQGNPVIGKISIASPNAASLGKYGDIPVSYHTGIPNIAIPIYTVKGGSLELPISITYHASGLKVQEQASWVGAGWSLNAGGVITRTVVGAPDDKGLNNLSGAQKGHFSDYGYNSYLFSPGPASCGSNGPAYCPTGRTGMPPSSYPPQDNYFQTGVFDGEPDLFFFNFNGHSGKFYFNDDRAPVIVPGEDLKITPSYAETGGLGITGFIITTMDGIQYFFGKNQNNDAGIDATERTFNISTQQSNYTGQGAISAWYLNKIESADGKFSILLDYSPEDCSYYTLAMFPIPAIENPNASAYNLEYDLVKNFTQGVRLSKIRFPDGEIQFNAGALRQDLGLGNTYTGLDEMANTNSGLGGKSLGNITIQSTNFCKKYTFSYGYFYDNSLLTGTLLTQAYPNLNLESDKYRLRLDEVRESICDDTKQLPPYHFDYFSEVTPPRKLSFGIDHWGFYNGVANTNLIPTYTIIPPSQSGTGSNTNPVTIVQGANRDASWPAMLAGALQKIDFPTGGSTSFEFEKNSLFNTSSYYSNVSLAFLAVHSTIYGQNYLALTYSTNFIVDPSSNSIDLSMTSNCNFSASLVIKDNSSNVVYTGGISNWDGFTGSNISFQNTISLPPGNYQAILALSPDANNSTVTGGVQVTIKQWQESTINQPVTVGGLRIKAITKRDGISASNNIVINYGYNFNNIIGGKSSGKLYSRPVYLQALRNDLWGTVSGASCSSSGCFTCFGSNASYYKSPSSIRPMSSTQGNHIGYGEVYVSQTGNGYTRYKYYGANGVISNEWDAPVKDVCVRTLNTLCEPGIPNSPAPPDPFDPMRGELASEKHYNSSSQLIKSSSYYPKYKFDSLITPGIISKFFITGYMAAASAPPTVDPVYIEGFYRVRDFSFDGFVGLSMIPIGINTFTEYSLQSVRKVRDSIVTEQFDLTTGNYLTDISTIYYKSKFHHQPTQIRNNTSKNENLVTNIKSAFDFRGSNINTEGELAGYYNNQNSDNAYLSSALGSLTTSSSDPNYYWERLNIFNNYRYMKAIDRQSYISSRISANNSYNAAHITAKASGDNTLKPILELRDEYKNPSIETVKWKEDLFIGSIYSHYAFTDPNLPFAYLQKAQSVTLSAPSASFSSSIISGNSIIKDSRYSDEVSIGFTNGNLTSITPRNNTSEVYLWGYKNTQVVVKIAFATYAQVQQAMAQSNITQAMLDNSGTGTDGQLRLMLEPLRTLLPQALVTTYTYKPLIGITSQTEPNGKTTYYEYDSFGRLKTVKDENNKVIKVMDYQYQKSVTN